MNLRAISTLALSVALIAFATVPTSYAATRTTAKATAKSTAKATVKEKAKAKASAKANPKITKSPTAKGSDAPGDGAGRFAQITATQRACLVKHGVKLPAPRPTGTRPTPAPNASRSPGGFRNGGLFDNPKTQAAFKTCGVVLPTGGFGGTFNAAKFQAFQKCMTAAGFTPTGGFGRYDQSDPDTAVALIKCQKKTGFTLPNRGQPGTSR